MKRTRFAIPIAAVFALLFLTLAALSNPRIAHAMTPEQQALYNEWYQARFGSIAPPSSQPQPQPPQAAQKGSIAPVQPSTFEQSLLELVNQRRAESGLGPVTLDPYVSAVARVKAQDMIENAYYGHGSSYGYSGSMLSYFGLSVRLSRENICQSYSAQAAHNVFMGSASHKENSLKAWWTGVGIGVVQKPGTSLYYVVEIFTK